MTTKKLVRSNLQPFYGQFGIRKFVRLQILDIIQWYAGIRQHKVEILPWMVIQASQKGSYSGISKGGVLFRHITVDYFRLYGFTRDCVTYLCGDVLRSTLIESRGCQWPYPQWFISHYCPRHHDTICDSKLLWNILSCGPGRNGRWWYQNQAATRKTRL